MTNLRPCPFCGGAAEILHEQAGLLNIIGSYVRCQQCGARTKTIKAAPSLCSDNEARKVWNTRYTEEESKDDKD